MVGALDTNALNDGVMLAQSLVSLAVISAEAEASAQVVAGDGAANGEDWDGCIKVHGA